MIEKKNNLDNLPFVSLKEGDLEQIQELENKLSEQLNSKVYLMALGESKE